MCVWRSTQEIPTKVHKVEFINFPEQVVMSLNNLWMPNMALFHIWLHEGHIKVGVKLMARKLHLLMLSMYVVSNIMHTLP